MINDDYGTARENARDILLFAWKVFDEKTTTGFNNLMSKPLSEVVPIGENRQNINVEEIVSKLDDVKNQLSEEIYKIIEKKLFDSEKSLFVDEDQEWIETRVKNAKKIGVNWFQSFVIKKGLPQKKYENIIHLWHNFCNQNLWMRYNNEPNFITCKDKGQIMQWYTTNNNHLLSCYHEAIFTIVQMRNVSEHLETNHYAQSFLKKLNEPVRDPLTDLKILFNSYTYFISMISVLTGILRSLQIFEESIKIALNNGVDESELPIDIENYIECSRCKREFVVPFDPDEGRKITCNLCGDRFSYKIEYAR